MKCMFSSNISNLCFILYSIVYWIYYCLFRCVVCGQVSLPLYGYTINPHTLTDGMGLSFPTIIQYSILFCFVLEIKGPHKYGFTYGLIILIFNLFVYPYANTYSLIVNL